MYGQIARGGSAVSADARHLVVLLHGLGGSGASLAPIASTWRRVMRGTAFASPDAPFPYPGSGHRWFDVDGRELRQDRIVTVRSAFDDVVGDAVKRAGFQQRLDKVAFVGVSQRAIVALDAVASGRWPIRALVTFAGLLPPMPVSRRAVSTSVLLIHGADDRTIPSAETSAAAQRLAAAGMDVESQILPGVGHTVSMDGVELALRFLANTFSEPSVRQRL